MTRIIALLSCLILCITCYTFANDNNLDSTWTVSEISYQNAQWTTYPDGRNPEIISYDLEVGIVNQDYHRVLTSSIQRSTYQDGIPTPADFLQTGDKLEILKEGFFPDGNGRSWFTLRHLPTSLEFEAQGNSIKPKLEAPTDESIIIIQDALIEKNDPNHISFKLDNAYVKASISDKYHGYYSGMPLKALGMSRTDEDPLGKFRYIFMVENLTTHEVQEFTSYPISEKKVFQTSVEKIFDGFGLPAYPSGGSNSYYLKIKFNLEDGSSYVTVGRYQDFIMNYEKKHFDKLPSIGNQISIIEETPDNSNGRQATLKFKSSKSGEIFSVRGPSRIALPESP